MRDERLNVAVVGCGGKARGHVRDLLKQPETNTIIVVSDPAPAAYEEMREIFASHDLAPPPNEPDLATLLETYGDELDAAIPSIGSTVDLYCTKGTLRTGIWGERLELQRESQRALAPVEVPTSVRVWDQFLAVRRGDLPNPSPAEVGLRMAKLWDAIRLSAEHGGERVNVGDGTLAREGLSPNG